MVFQRPSTVRSTAFRSSAFSFAKAIVRRADEELGVISREAGIIQD